MTDLISVEEYLEKILGTVRPLNHFPQPLLESLGLPACEDVHSSISLPVFDNSAMDGYAVCHADVAAATADSPVHLPVVGEIGAGQATLLAMSPGTAVKIMTGAPVPQGCDAIVPYEWTDRGVANVVVSQAPSLGQHIRPAGQDVQVGDLIVEDGSLLGPRQIGLLAAVGRDRISTRPRPRVVVISTGSELREPGTPLAHDSIYDANSYLLAAAARRAGAIVYRVGIVRDDATTFRDALADQLVRADLVITSGGVSEGDYDIVKESLRELGTVWFGGVAMQPGKPQGFGLVGEDETPIFTLPGNPVSSYVSFQVFVLPAIRRMMGLLPYSRPFSRGLLTHAISSPPGRRQFLRAAYDVDAGRAVAAVTPVGGAGSHLIGDLAESNCLVVVPEDVTSIAAGEQVQVLRLDEEF
ncbi:molybdotransferase-like divisome protein Glp [Nocardioides sp.]|uniref:molybdotransferase-like divisome protein Glp n=1 Tax=Nocardioides sp. TaxID=35761 RepID=UPI003D0DDA25